MLYLQNSDKVYYLGLSFFKTENDAMDFVQDVYLLGKKKYSLFKKEAQFSTWLYQVAKNYAIDRIRKNKKIKHLTDLSYGGDNKDGKEIDLVTKYQDEVVASEYFEKEMSSLERDVLDQELFDKLKEKINLLPEQYRLPLVLFYEQQMSYKEIAYVLSTKENNIRIVLFRAKQMLEKQFKDDIYP